MKEKLWYFDRWTGCLMAQGCGVYAKTQKAAELKARAIFPEMFEQGERLVLNKNMTKLSRAGAFEARK